MTEKLRHVCELHNVEFYDIIKNFEQIHEVPPAIGVFANLMKF